MRETGRKALRNLLNKIMNARKHQRPEMRESSYYFTRKKTQEIILTTDGWMKILARVMEYKKNQRAHQKEYDIDSEKEDARNFEKQFKKP